MATSHHFFQESFQIKPNSSLASAYKKPESSYLSSRRKPRMLRPRQSAQHLSATLLSRL
ncbi:hypothetical protein C4K26_3962 [Pseudomonas chlororaphis]|nr:hypothetical protein C4K26_3962 [Pseudomonas chlororaphis]